MPHYPTVRPQESGDDGASLSEPIEKGADLLLSLANTASQHAAAEASKELVKWENDLSSRTAAGQNPMITPPMLDETSTRGHSSSSFTEEDAGYRMIMSVHGFPGHQLYPSPIKWKESQGNHGTPPPGGSRSSTSIEQTLQHEQQRGQRRLVMAEEPMSDGWSSSPFSHLEDRRQSNGSSPLFSPPFDENHSNSSPSHANADSSHRRLLGDSKNQPTKRSLASSMNEASEMTDRRKVPRQDLTLCPKSPTVHHGGRRISDESNDGPTTRQNLAHGTEGSIDAATNSSSQPIISPASSVDGAKEEETPQGMRTEGVIVQTSSTSRHPNLPPQYYTPPYYHHPHPGAYPSHPPPFHHHHHHHPSLYVVPPPHGYYPPPPYAPYPPPPHHVYGPSYPYPNPAMGHFYAGQASSNSTTPAGNASENQQPPQQTTTAETTKIHNGNANHHTQPVSLSSPRGTTGRGTQAASTSEQLEKISDQPPIDTSCDKNMKRNRSPRCIPLPHPLPASLWSDDDAELAQEMKLPDFGKLVNYPDYVGRARGENAKASSTAEKRHCVMCGQSRATSAGSLVNRRQHTSNGSKTLMDDASLNQMTVHIIPRQNKGVCTACDVTVWRVMVHPPEGDRQKLEIKWCKGCKNFRPWQAFGEKGLATKCLRCRTRQKEKYAQLKTTTMDSSANSHYRLSRSSSPEDLGQEEKKDDSDH